MLREMYIQILIKNQYKSNKNLRHIKPSISSSKQPNDVTTVTFVQC